MTTTEAMLTRKFAINFIDARTTVTEARLNLNIHGYPSHEQKELLFAEASRIIEGYPAEVRQQMQAHRVSLEDAKNMNGSSSDLSTSSNHSNLRSHLSSASYHSMNSSTRSLFFVNR